MDQLVTSQDSDVVSARTYNKLDLIAAECIMSSLQEPPPLIHRFTNGMYIREIYLNKDTVAVTKIHNTEHPYVISKGSVSVSNDGESWIHIEAPYTGITTPGTQRVIIVHEDTIWTTFHPNPENEKDLDVLETKIIREHSIPRELIDGYQEKLIKDD